jgi:hypothetical protein
MREPRYYKLAYELAYNLSYELAYELAYTPRFCHLIGPKQTRIDFGGGNLVWGWQMKKNPGSIHLPFAVNFKGELAGRLQLSGCPCMHQGL